MAHGVESDIKRPYEEIPGDVVEAWEALSRVFQCYGDAREGIARDLLACAQRGELVAYAMTYRWPSWLWREVLLHADPLDPVANTPESLISIAAVPEAYWFRNDQLRELELRWPTAHEDAATQGATLLTHDNATRFVAECMGWGTSALRGGTRDSRPDDKAQAASMVRDAVAAGSRLNPKLRWETETRLGLSLSDLEMIRQASGDRDHGSKTMAVPSEAPSADGGRMPVDLREWVVTTKTKGSGELKLALAEVMWSLAVAGPFSYSQVAVYFRTSHACVGWTARESGSGGHFTFSDGITEINSRRLSEIRRRIEEAARTERRASERRAQPRSDCDGDPP